MGKTRLRNPTAASYNLGKSGNGPASISQVYNFVNRHDGGLGVQGFINSINSLIGSRVTQIVSSINGNVIVGAR